MKFVLKTVKQGNDQQLNNTGTAKFVRRNWIVFAGYYVIASLVVGVGVAVAMFVFGILGYSKHGNGKPMPVKGVLIFSTAILIVVSAIALISQLISGPFVLTKDVVCRKCHTRSRRNRVEFFRGRYSRPAKCECGGKFDPAFLWKPEPDMTELNPSA